MQRDIEPPFGQGASHHVSNAAFSASGDEGEFLHGKL
jgi:hypothetical protein